MRTCNFDIRFNLLSADEDYTSKKMLQFSIVYMGDSKRVPLRSLSHDMVFYMRDKLTEEMRSVTKMQIILYREKSAHELTFYVEPIGDWIDSSSAGAYLLQQLMY